MVEITTEAGTTEIKGKDMPELREKLNAAALRFAGGTYTVHSATFDRIIEDPSAGVWTGAATIVLQCPVEVPPADGASSEETVAESTDEPGPTDEFIAS